MMNRPFAVLACRLLPLVGAMMTIPRNPRGVYTFMLLPLVGAMMTRDRGTSAALYSACCPS